MLPKLAKTTTNSIKALVLASTIIAGVGMTTTYQAHAYAPPAGYADLVEQVSPAVVFIEVTVKRPDAGPQAAPIPLPPGFPPIPGFPFPQQRPDQGPQQGKALGSGFIVTADGEVVTNNHVVENAIKVTVKLQNGKTYSAKVVGTDPLTDIALLKLEDAENLPTVPFADSSTVRVGDAVVAVGNPFGLGGTVTAGIVSALGRDINSGPYDSFIQTDAAINRGNSGGPLFNTKGEVVGMNTAIFSPSGGSVGIGFSIPARTVQSIVKQLRENGVVSRGWLGVQIQEITPALAQALGLEKTEGALVADVQPDSPALKAGVKTGDVILAVNGQKIAQMHELPSLIAALPAGSKAELTILRDGKEQTLNVTIGNLSSDKMAVAGNKLGSLSPDALGITVEPLTPETAARLGLRDGEKGVVITQIDPDSPNAEKLRPGDVIEEADNKPVATPQDLAAALKSAGDKKAILLRINRNGTSLYIGAELPNS